jgi:GntR family carbon starvation induced transcriptional regulator
MNRKMRSVSHKRPAAATTASAAQATQRRPGGPVDDIASADVFQSLRSDIVNGSLKPGARLRFIELQARYGIGTSPIREALSRLAADRLVIQEVNRGFSVPPLSLEDFADITALRLTLERGAIRASIARGDEAWEEELVLAHHRLRRLGRPESDPEDESIPEEWERRHRAFHMALIAACGSPWTLHFCGVLYDQFDRYRRRAGRDAATQAGLSRQHDQLADSAIARDAARADSILEDHINTTARMVARRLGRPD